MKPKQILFYCSSQPPEMVYKIALVLKKNIYQTILFTMSEKDRFKYNFFKQVFDKIYCSDFQFLKQNFKKASYYKKIPTLLKFITALKFYKPYTIIAVGGNNWQLKLAHKYFFKKYPFIYFPYDIISHFLNKNSKDKPREFEIQAERYCLEKSDGIIHKGGSGELEVVNGRLYNNLKLSELQVNFLPYCSKEFIIPLNKNKLSDEDGEIHIVNAGYLLDTPDFVNRLSYIFKELLKQKIHIHLYTKATHLTKEKEKSFITDLYSEISKHKYFHIHQPVGPTEIVSEISKYDIGFWPITKKTNEKIEPVFAMGNRISTYLEAGIPIFYDDESIFLGEIIKKYKIGLSYNDENIKNIKQKLKKLNFAQLNKNILKARQDFDMDKNFPRMENFIKKVVAKKYQS